MALFSLNYLIISGFKMTSQQNITSYFNARKRIRCDNVKNRTKVLILEAEKSIQKTIEADKDKTTKIIYQESQKIEISASTSNSVVNTIKPKSVKKAASSSKKAKPSVSTKGKDKLKQSLLTEFTKKSVTFSPTPSTSSSKDEIAPEAAVVEPTPSVEPSTSTVPIPGTPKKASASRALDFSGSPAKILLGSSKDMSIDAIKARLQAGGSKVDALKASLTRFSKLDEGLKKVEAQEEALKLKHFDKVLVEVPLSPKKEPVILPSSAISPTKALGSRLAAWKQHRVLAEARAPTLPLSHRLKSLNERFRAADIVASMMVNRGEDVTFTKLQPGVEEMCRFLRQEKRKTFALTGRPDEFLKHLDPPMEVDRNKLTRWHPGFDAEQVPDVPPAVLPEAPNQDKISTAREALLSAAKEKEKAANAADSNVPLNPAFRGIPTSLLEKIRAKQAARALEAMTRTPSQDARKTRLERLPELARVLRSVFVAEKKAVMPLDTRISMRQTVFYKLDRGTSMAEVISRLERHEELRSVGVWSRVCHGDDSHPRVSQLKVLILKLVAVDGASSRAIVV
ncbi:hypothetical protein B566_EDAN005186, partial [Ephemera danica]